MPVLLQGGQAGRRHGLRLSAAVGGQKCRCRACRGRRLRIQSQRQKSAARAQSPESGVCVIQDGRLGLTPLLAEDHVVWCDVGALEPAPGGNSVDRQLQVADIVERNQSAVGLRRGARESALHSQAARKVLRHKVLLLTAAVNEDVSLLPVGNRRGHAQEAHGSPQKAHMMRR